MQHTPSITETISRTGFVLEHNVASAFEHEKWTVIHNRYYLDDVTSIQREMDMIAYKTNILADKTRLVTAVIISCKKNVEFDWVFLTRKAPGMGLNINMLPITFASNMDAFKTELSYIDWNRDAFIEKFDNTSLLDKLYNYNRTVFAYQEIRKTNNAPSNDSKIYDSISSLLKAQAYEVNALNNGRNQDEKFVYNINLLSVADLDFHELHYEKESVSESKINRINYLNRFLINENEQHSKIDFVRFDSLDEAIHDYNSLHMWNLNFYKIQMESFYKNAYSDSKRRNVILKDNGDYFLINLNVICSYLELPFGDFEKIDFHDNGDEIIINVSDDVNAIAMLNSTEVILNDTSNWLKEAIRYEGKFKFGEDDGLPF